MSFLQNLFKTLNLPVVVLAAGTAIAEPDDGQVLSGDIKVKDNLVSSFSVGSNLRSVGFDVLTLLEGTNEEIEARMQRLTGKDVFFFSHEDALTIASYYSDQIGFDPTDPSISPEDIENVDPMVFVDLNSYFESEYSELYAYLRDIYVGEGREGYLAGRIEYIVLGAFYNEDKVHLPRSSRPIITLDISDKSLEEYIANKLGVRSLPENFPDIPGNLNLYRVHRALHELEHATSQTDILTVLEVENLNGYENYGARKQSLEIDAEVSAFDNLSENLPDDFAKFVLDTRLLVTFGANILSSRESSGWFTHGMHFHISAFLAGEEPPDLLSQREIMIGLVSKAREHIGITSDNREVFRDYSAAYSNLYANCIGYTMSIFRNLMRQEGLLTPEEHVYAEEYYSTAANFGFNAISLDSLTNDYISNRKGNLGLASFDH